MHAGSRSAGLLQQAGAVCWQGHGMLPTGGSSMHLFACLIAAHLEAAGLVASREMPRKG